MTQEEKAQRYDEAIEIAKSWHADAQIGFKKSLESLFPELKESDDERIRKKLIDYFKENNAALAFEGISNESVLAWLEKQKTSDEALQYLKENHSPSEVSDFQAAMNIAVAKAYDKGYNDGLKKQGEQKSVDKVEPKFKVGDKIYLKPEYRMPDDDTPIANTVFEIRAIDDKHYRFDGSYIFIEDQDEYELVEQNHAWSEEDATHYNRILKELNLQKEMPINASVIEEVKSDIIWLKSLKDRVQPKQEWSEDDEKVLHAIRNALNYEKPRNYLKSRDFEFTDILDWLKSLRQKSLWKPSDSQMASITCAVRKMKESACYDSELVSLFNDLKKLEG